MFDNLKSVDAKELDNDPDFVMRKFSVIKIRDLFPDTSLPCDIYFPAMDEATKRVVPGKLLNSGQIYNEDVHHYLMREEIGQLYILPEDENEYLKYFNIEMQKLIKSPSTPSEKKTELLYDNAESVVKKVFREHPNKTNIQTGKQLTDELALHLTSEQVSVKALLSLFSKDYYTYTHSVQVAILGMSFCNFIGWSKTEVADFGLGALFHDVGKNSISEAILNKPGKLTREEFDIIKNHSVTGYTQLLKSTVLSQDQLDLVLYHHESMDGSGYPEGLYGNRIPRFARIVHVIDVFDALSSNRPYKGAMSHSDALKLMTNEMRSSFDEELIIAFAKFLGEPITMDGGSEEKMRVELGTVFSLQPRKDDIKMKSVLVGMEEGKYLILKVSPSIQGRVAGGTKVLARYIHDGQVIGFLGTVTQSISGPDPLLFLTYPDRLEKISLRTEERVTSFLPGTVQIRESQCRGLILDINSTGCKLSITGTEKEKLPLVINDEKVQIRASLPTSEAVELDGLIKWSKTNQQTSFLGVQFTDLPKQIDDSLQNYLGEMRQLIR